MLRDLSFGCLAAACLLILPPATAAPSEDAKAKPPITAQEAFAKLKTLEGTWKNRMAGEHGAHESKVIYRLTGAGSALVETDFPDSDHEMVSVYHLDKDDLRMTHYCAAGNQPRLKLDRGASTPEKLVFVFDGGTNLDPDKDMHIHGLTVTFTGEGKVRCAWESKHGGQKADTMLFHLSREQP